MHFQDPKLHYVTNIGSQNIPIEEKTLVIVYGTDFVNTNYLSFCCDRREIAKVNILNFLTNIYFITLSVFISKHQ